MKYKVKNNKCGIYINIELKLNIICTWHHMLHHSAHIFTLSLYIYIYLFFLQCKNPVVRKIKQKKMWPQGFWQLWGQNQRLLLCPFPSLPFSHLSSTVIFPHFHFFCHCPLTESHCFPHIFPPCPWQLCSVLFCFVLLFCHGQSWPFNLTWACFFPSLFLIQQLSNEQMLLFASHQVENRQLLIFLF